MGRRIMNDGRCMEMQAGEWVRGARPVKNGSGAKARSTMGLPDDDFRRLLLFLFYTEPTFVHLPLISSKYNVYIPISLM